MMTAATQLEVMMALAITALRERVTCMVALIYVSQIVNPWRHGRHDGSDGRAQMVILFIVSYNAFLTPCFLRACLISDWCTKTMMTAVAQLEVMMIFTLPWRLCNPILVFVTALRVPKTLFNYIESVLAYQISYFPSLMSFRQLHFAAYNHDGGPPGPAKKHLSTCFGLLYGRISKFEALELPVEFSHGLRTSICPSFSKHYDFSTTIGVILSRLATSMGMYYSQPVVINSPESSETCLSCISPNFLLQHLRY